MYTITDKIALPMYKKVVKEYPQSTYYCESMDQVSIEMHDGVHLNTRIFKPNHKGPYDVLFTRNPYPSNEKLYEAIYLPFVEQGYCLVIQDCRGTGNSEGNWEPFKNERKDGIDSLNWLQDKQWVKTIVTFGRSYSAFTQWIVGDKLPSKVKSMVLEVYGVNRFDQVYSNGLFREDVYTSWAFANSGVKSSLSTGKQYQLALSHSPAVTRDQSILGQSLEFYQKYLRETDPTGSYWQDSIWQILLNIPQKINVPVLVTDGWADHHLQGSLLGFHGLQRKIREQSRIIVTPTDHIGNTTGDLNYGDSNRFGFMNMKANLEWINYILGYTDNVFSSAYYLMQGANWLNPEQLNVKPSRLYLEKNFMLDKKAKQNGKISFNYDPTHPNTWPGGNELLAWITPGFTDLPHGFVKKVPYPEREDTIRFESTKFEVVQKLVGKITVHLKVSSNCEDTAFAVRICEHTKENKYINIKDGISSLSGRNNIYNQSYKPSEEVLVSIPLGDIAWEIKPGSSIVILVSSSNFPMYSIHSNKKGAWSSQQIDQKIAHQTVFVGEKGSFIELPFVKA